MDIQGMHLFSMDLLASTYTSDSCTVRGEESFEGEVVMHNFSQLSGNDDL
jgi:hypothetical protein